MSRRTLAISILLTSVLVVAYLVALAFTQSVRGTRAEVEPYSLNMPRMTGRVVLFILDSWAARIVEDESYMPRLSLLKKRGAAGVIWAAKQSGTEQGIIAYATGMPTDSVDFLRLFSDASHEGWTLFEDIRARGDTLCFSGDQSWVTHFGQFGTHNCPTNGRAGSLLAGDLLAIKNTETELASSSSPVFSVVHILETDFLAHQFGTSGAQYRAAMGRWDNTMCDFVERVLDDRTTVIITSDHGNDIWGSHGGAYDIHRRAPVVMVGRGIRRTEGFTMNAVDMPATVALLLGTRLPGGALAKPATVALDLTPKEEARILLGTYEHLIDLGEKTDVPAASAQRQTLDGLRRLEEGGQFAELTRQAEESSVSLIEALQPTGRFSLLGFAWVLVIFGAAAFLLYKSGVLPDRTAGGFLLVVFLTVEPLLGVRFSLVPEIKQLLHLARTHAVVSALGLAAIIPLAWRAARPVASRCWRVLEGRPLLGIVVGFLFLSAFLPLGNLSIVFLCLLVAGLWRARVPASKSALILLIFAAYLVLSPIIAWPHLGENAARRYAYAGAVAALTAVWLLRGPLRSLGWGPRAALVLLLVMSPFTWLNIATGSATIDLVAATVSLVALAVLVRMRGGSWLCLPALGATELVFLAHSHAAFWGALVVIAAVGIYLVRFETRGRTLSLSAAVLVASMLCVLSKPGDVPSIVAILAMLVWTTDLLVEGSMSTGALVGLWAVVLLCTRLAVFEAFGKADAPVQVYLFSHIDLAAGFLGSENESVARAALLVLLKVTVAAGIVFLPLFMARLRSSLRHEIAAMVAAFMLIELAQMAVRLNLSVGRLTERSGNYLVSIFIYTGLYLTIAVAFGALEWGLLRRHDELLASNSP